MTTVGGIAEPKMSAWLIFSIVVISMGSIFWG